MKNRKKTNWRSAGLGAARSLFAVVPLTGSHSFGADVLPRFLSQDDETHEINPNCPPPIHFGQQCENLRRLILCILIMQTVFASCKAQDLVGYWRFDQKGGEFPNLVGSPAPAKWEPQDRVDEMVLVPDEVDEIKYVVEFDGSGNSWIDAAVKLTGDNFTAELWIKAQANDKEAFLLGNRAGVMLMTKPNGTLSFFLASAEGGQQWSYVDIPHAVFFGEWVHCMARFSENTQELFVESNGEVLRSKAIKLEPSKRYPWSQVVLGMNPSNQTLPFHGCIAALKIYQGALSEEDFQKSEP